MKLRKQSLDYFYNSKINKMMQIFNALNERLLKRDKLTKFFSLKLTVCQICKK